MKIRWILPFLLLAGCAGSPEIRFYTLSTVAPKRTFGSTGFTLASVRLPSITDRPQILLRTGPQTVELLDDDRWAEPLDQAVPRILAQDLSLRQQNNGGPRITLAIDDFIADRAGVVTLSGHWWSAAPDSDRSLAVRRAFQVTAPLPGTSAVQIAAAMSEALARLADQLTEER